MNQNQIRQIKACRGNRTQKEYADFLNVDLRSVQNWETRGTSKTTLHILVKIRMQEIKIEELKKQLEEDNMTFQL